MRSGHADYIGHGRERDKSRDNVTAIRRRDSKANFTPTSFPQDVAIFLQLPQPSRILTAEPTPMRPGGWQTPPKTKRPPKPAPAANVVPFSPTERVVLPSLKVNAGFSRPTGREHEEPDTFDF